MEEKEYNIKNKWINKNVKVSSRYSKTTDINQRHGKIPKHSKMFLHTDTHTHPSRTNRLDK